jgi:phosphate-selective porin OprO/OprP
MQFQYSKFAVALLSAGILSSPAIANANDSNELEELRALVQELSQKVKVIERKDEINEEAAVAAKKETPVVKASANGFGIESADGKNSIKFSGLLQADYRSYQDGANDVRNRTNTRAGSLDANGFHDANDTALLRRIRPTIQGTLFGKYDFRFTPEFAGGSASAVDAYIDARLDPAFKIRAGKYKPFVGLERLQGGSDIKFVERSYVTNAILPNRDVGVSVYGDVFGDKLSYAVGVNNGVVDGGNATTGNEFDGSKEVTARLFATPFKDDANALSGLGFGIAGTYTNIDGERNLDFTNTTAADATRNGLPSYLTDGQQTFFRYGSASVADGKRSRITPQASYYYGPLGLITEYARVNQDVSLLTNTTSNAPSVIAANSSKTLSHDAWQVAVSYLLTGEDASFRGVKPKNNFDIDKGGWGAWELVARYSEINLDSDTFKNKNTGSFSTGTYANLSESAKSAKSWTAGVNWYLNQNAKVQLNYSHTSFDGGAGIGITAVNAAGTNIRDRQSENALLARFQVAF